MTAEASRVAIGENGSRMAWFLDETFDRVARSFDNPDWVAVTLHSYQSRWDEADPDAVSQWLKNKSRTTPALSLPTIYIHGEVDGVSPLKRQRTLRQNSPDRLNVSF